MKKTGTPSNRQNLFDCGHPGTVNLLIEYNKEKTLNDKVEMLLLLGQKAGYSKLTDKQVFVAYYGKYTTQNRNDVASLSEIRDCLVSMKEPYCRVVDLD